jgi:hypothetical protein
MIVFKWKNKAYPLPASHEINDTGTPWGIQASRLQQGGCSPENARDLVILDWLRKGDTRPLADLLRTGIVPSSLVLSYLASMLHPADGTEDAVSYMLVPKRRREGRGANDNPEIEIRDQLIADNIERLMREIGPGGYDAAVKQLSTLIGLSEKTIRNAYDLRKRRRSGKHRRSDKRRRLRQ